MEEPLESGLAPEHVFLLVVHIKNIELSRAFSESTAPCAQKAAQHRCAKGIEEKCDARSARKREICNIAANHAHGRARAAGGAPKRKIPAGDAREGGMQLNANDGAKGIIRGEQHGAPHAGAQIDEGVSVDRSEWLASTPTDDDALKDGGRDCVVGRDMPVVTMARAEVPPGNQAAGAHAKLQVEGVADQSIFLHEPRQAAFACDRLRFRFE